MEKELKLKQDSRFATYRQISTLSNSLNSISISVIPKNLRKVMYDLKVQLESANIELQQERTIIMLLNGGIEKENQGNKYIATPDMPVRSATTGTDEEFSDKVRKHFEVKNKIEKEIADLLVSKSKIQISAVLTEDEFEELGVLIGILDWQSLETLLVKK